ncbi:MAG: twin-arginine translocation signal domain-containing protein [Desulfobacterales bacterium]|jgi:hypothetical protein
MSKEKAEKIGRRDFLKKTGVASLAAGAVTFGGVSLATAAAAESEDDAINRYWQKKQREYEANEKNSERLTMPLAHLRNMYTGERTGLMIRQRFMRLFRRNAHIYRNFSPFIRKARQVSTSSIP